MSKKAAYRKRRLLKVQEVLRQADKEIEYLHSMVKSHASKKTRFKVESKRLLEKISKVTWDMVVQVARMQGQLWSAQVEVLALELLLASRE